MDNPQTTETVSPDTEMHDRMMAAAEAADRGEADSPLDTPPSATQGGEDTATDSTRAADSDKEQADNNSPDNPEPSAEERVRDEKGKFVKKEEAGPATKEAPKDGAPEATKAQKEEARLGKSWQQLEQEKLEARRELAETRQLKDELLRLKQDLSSRPSDPAGKFGSKEFTRAADEFEDRGNKLLKDGDIDGAMQQFDYRDRSRQAAKEAAQQEANAHQGQFIEQWDRDMRSYSERNREFADPTNEHTKQMQALLADPKLKWVQYVPGGFEYAAEYIKRGIAAAEASGLREENTKLKTENERLTKLTTPAGGKDSAKHSATRKFTDMSQEEQHAHLAREAELADAA